jgi:hypothetical protein
VNWKTSVVDPDLLNPDSDPGFLMTKNSSLKDVQATGEAFSPQKRTSSTAKIEIY